MTNSHDLDTVAAFIDGERVDPVALKRALATEEGRDYLVELVAMRELIAGPTAPAATLAPAATRASSWRGLAMAAVVALTVGIAGYALGAISHVVADKAPAPTVAVTSSQGWQEVKGGN